jgi:hypothetical protein
MRPGAILINTARGPVVDEDALLEALESGRIAAAGLDVVEREPLENEGLRNHPNVLFTPHTAFYSAEGYTELRTKTAEEVRRLLLREPPRNPVNVVNRYASYGPHLDGHGTIVSSRSIGIEEAPPWPDAAADSVIPSGRSSGGGRSDSSSAAASPSAPSASARG